MPYFKRGLAAIALASAIPWAGLAATTASSQESAYPDRPVSMVIGFPPGGSADALARLIAGPLGAALGQKVIVQYKPGAGGNIGAEYVARATPDGYTLFLGGRPNAIHKTMYGTMKYDFMHDLVPVGLVARLPFVMVSGRHAPIRSMQDLVRLARAHPGALTCASPGRGTTSHLLCELLQQETGLDMQHVAYTGGIHALTEIIAGRIDMYISPVAGALPHIQADKIRPIVVMSPLRLAMLPRVPTLAEAGVAELSGLELGDWSGLVAPAGTPSHVVAKLSQSINTALTDPSLHEAMARQGFGAPMQPNTPESFKAFIAEETDRWNQVLRTRRIRPLH
jgi:tripartite-type tricarboxylate transporter receptor subunit TctC